VLPDRGADHEVAQPIPGTPTPEAIHKLKEGNKVDLGRHAAWLVCAYPLKAMPIHYHSTNLILVCPTDVVIEVLTIKNRIRDNWVKPACRSIY
jgi:hypothetical protein